MLAKQFGVQWSGRDYDAEDWGASDLPNRCLSAATACLYGVTEAAVLAAGYAPAVGFIHTGKPLSFVYDVADIYKFETVVPVAFKVAASNPAGWRCGCWKCGPASTWAATAGAFASTSGRMWKKASKAATR